MIGSEHYQKSFYSYYRIEYKQVCENFHKMFYSIFYSIFKLFIIVYSRIDTVAEAFVIPKISPDLSDAISKTFKNADKIFSDCTLHFPVVNTTNNPNIKTIEIDLQQFRHTIKLISTLAGLQVTNANLSKTLDNKFNNDLSTIFWRIFSIQRYSLPCTVRVISANYNNNNSLKDPIVNLTPYIFSGLFEHRYEEAWNENTYKLRKMNPDYVLAIIPELHKDNLYFVISPESMASSKLVVMTKTSSYLNCIACSKWHLLMGDYLSEDVLDYNKMSRVGILVNFQNFSQLSTIILLDNQWFGLNLNLQGFGMPDNGIDKRSQGQTCSEKLLKEMLEVRSPQTYPEQDCIIYLILENLNCTSYACRRHLVVNLNYYSSIVNENFGGADYAIAHGAQWDGLRFALVLGGNEGRRGYAEFGAITRPFSWTVWVFIGISIILVTIVILQIGRVFKVGRVIIWVIGSMFENGEVLNIRIGLVFGWIFGCFFARNLYTSVLYSHLTKQPKAENIPENMEQLFQNDNQSNIQIFADLSVSYQIYRHMSVLEERNNGCLNGFEEIVNKIKIIWINANTTQFIKNVSKLGTIECEDMMRETGEIEKCNVGGRLALLYNIIGWRSNYSPRFVKPMISLFGGRKLVENVNSPSILNEPLLWFTVDKFFYLKSFESNLAYLFESGIQSTFKIRYETGKIGNVMRGVNKEGSFDFEGNFLTFAENVVRRTGYVGEDEGTKEMIWDSEKVSMRDVWVAVVLWLYGLVGCIVGVTLEQVWWSRQSRYA